MYCRNCTQVDWSSPHWCRSPARACGDRCRPRPRILAGSPPITLNRQEIQHEYGEQAERRPEEAPSDQQWYPHRVVQ